MEGLSARGVIVKRRLHNGAIAGIVVGVCVATAIILLCLYPVVVGLLKRRKKAKNEPETVDPETGEVPRPGGPPGADDSHRRLSSQESFKPDEEVARGGVGGDSGKDLPWATNEAPGFSYGQTQTQPQPYTAPIDTTASAPYGQSEYQTAPFPYSEEFMPQGANAEYYSPSVPSEAFGMVTTADTPIGPDRTISRGSSLRQNVKQLFSRKSTRDQSFSAPSSPIYDESQETPAGWPAPQSQTVALQQVTTVDRTESPTQIEASTTAMPPPPLPTALASPLQLASQPKPQHAVQTPPQSPPIEPKFKLSPSFPAPGTVNPMDIMPATTESEMWHRTEHQIFMSSQSSPPVPEQSDREESQDAPSPFSLPQSTVRPTPVVLSPTPTQMEPVFKAEPAEDDVTMADIPSQNHLSPLPDYHARHTSYPSDQSTPLPGPASTNPSTQNTPATVLDTPSPKSEGTSDYRHSTSPNPAAGNFSPKTGAYPCDEPGCHQVFDQPHKLK